MLTFFVKCPFNECSVNEACFCHFLAHGFMYRIPRFLSRLQLTHELAQWCCSICISLNRFRVQSLSSEKSKRDISYWGLIVWLPGVQIQVWFHKLKIFVAMKMRVHFLGMQSQEFPRSKLWSPTWQTVLDFVSYDNTCHGCMSFHTLCKHPAQSCVLVHGHVVLCRCRL